MVIVTQLHSPVASGGMNRSHGRVKVLSQQLVASEASEVSEDVDLDTLAYGFMASSALFAALE